MQSNVANTQFNQQYVTSTGAQNNNTVTQPITQAQPPVQTNCNPQVAVPQANNLQVPPNYSGVNIQIFNPSVATPGSQLPTYNVAPPCPQQGPSSYGAGYYTNNYNGNNGGQNGVNQTSTDTTKKTEKRNIVVLTDDYIKNLENYLNSQDKEVRLMGAKEVMERLQEDPERKDDKALNALVNKMLQDPSQKIKLLALSALDSRVASGDDYTVKILKNMQNETTGYGQDALQASNILLKMSGQTAEKEFEVKNNKKTEAKTNETPKTKTK